MSISRCRNRTFLSLPAGYEARVHADALPWREFKGKVTAINSMVDNVTRNISLQATLDNSAHEFAPWNVCQSRRHFAGEKQNTRDSG